MPPQNNRHVIQRPCYQRGSPCQDPAGNRTTQRPPDHCKEMQTAMVWSFLPFIRSGKKPSCKAQRRGKNLVSWCFEPSQPQRITSGLRGGKQTRQTERRRWEDNTREWTDLESAKSQRAVENREKRRKLVAKSSMVPQRPSRLRD